MKVALNTINQHKPSINLLKKISTIGIISLTIVSLMSLPPVVNFFLKLLQCSYVMGMNLSCQKLLHFVTSIYQNNTEQWQNMNSNFRLQPLGQNLTSEWWIAFPHYKPEVLFDGFSSELTLYIFSYPVLNTLHL